MSIVSLYFIVIFKLLMRSIIYLMLNGWKNLEQLLCSHILINLHKLNSNKS